MLVAPVVAFGVGHWLGKWREHRRFRATLTRLQALGGDRGRVEAALVVSVGERSAAAAVRGHLEAKGLASMPVLEVHETAALSDRDDDWLRTLGRVKDKTREMSDLGVSRVHLFMACPVVLGVLVGAVLNNGPEVVVYHYFNGVYLPVNRMAHEVVKM